MNDRIVSLQNPRVKRVRALRRARVRKKEGLFVIEGRKMVEEALRDCPWAVEEIYVTETALTPCDHPRLFPVSESVYAAISRMQEPPGILALVRTDAIPSETADRRLLLDGVSDPGNLGTLLRTAEAFGYSVYLTEDCADPLNEKCVQASMGSILRHMPVTLKPGAIRALSSACEFVGASLDGDVPVPRPRRPFVLVLGSESHGIRPELDSLLHTRIRIPMEGKAESLNVAVAGGILMNGLL